MTKTLTVNIPARTLKLSREVRKVPARVETLTQDDAGQWFVAFNGGLRLMPLVPAASLRGIARGINPELAVEADRPL